MGDANSDRNTLAAQHHDAALRRLHLCLDLDHSLKCLSITLERCDREWQRGHSFARGNLLPAAAGTFVRPVRACRARALASGRTRRRRAAR